MNTKLVPLNKQKVHQLRQSLSKEIDEQIKAEKERIEEEIAYNEQKFVDGKPIGWKNLINGVIPDTAPKKPDWNIEQGRPYIWEAPEVGQLITEKQKADLTKLISMAKEFVKDPVSSKFLQMKLYVDLLDKLIAESKKAVLIANRTSDKPQALLSRLASLKVEKKKLEEERHVRAQHRDFKDEREVLTYSWRLFIDEINQKVPLLTEMKNPRIEFNR